MVPLIFSYRVDLDMEGESKSTAPGSDSSDISHTPIRSSAEYSSRGLFGLWKPGGGAVANN